MKKLGLAIAVTLMLLGCEAQQSQSRPQSSSQSSSQSRPQSSPAVEFESVGDACEVPQAIQDNPLVQEIATIPIGATLEEVESRAGTPPTTPYTPFAGVDGGVITWSQDDASQIVEIQVGFAEGEVTERSVALGTEVGTANEKICTWRIK